MFYLGSTVKNHIVEYNFHFDYNNSILVYVRDT